MNEVKINSEIILREENQQVFHQSIVTCSQWCILNTSLACVEQNRGVAAGRLLSCLAAADQQSSI